MNLKQSKVILEKINALHNSMSMDENSVASIERDLMLSYIKQLYELFLHDEGNSRPASMEQAGNARQGRPVAKRTYTPPRIIEIPDTQKATKMSPSPDPVPDPMPDEPNPEPKREPEPRPTPPPPQPQPVPPPTPQQPPQRPVAADDDGGFSALFEFKAAKELSEKLSERPINDLTKALAINDRLLYMNELFGKDLSALNDSLSTLNQYSKLEEARGLLFNLAQQYNWTEEERQPVARDFIKLVRRRYQ